MGCVQQICELVELTEYLQRSCEVLKSGAWVAVFHAPNRIDGGADALSQGLLGQMPAAACKGHALPDPAQGSFNGKWNRTLFQAYRSY